MSSLTPVHPEHLQLLLSPGSLAGLLSSVDRQGDRIRGKEKRQGEVVDSEIGEVR